MDITELNERLSALTNHEVEYRANGSRYLGWETGPREVINGRVVYRSDISPTTPYHGSRPRSFSTSNTAIGETAHNDKHAKPDRLGFALPSTFPIFVKQNSRFSAVPEHVHNAVELSYVYTGNCPQVVDGEPITLMADEVLLLDTGCPHSIGELGEQDIMISIMLPRDFLAQCLMDAGSPESYVSRFLVNALAGEADHNHHVLFHSQGNRRIRRFFQELMCEYLDPSPNAEPITLGLFRLILMELINVYEADYNRREQTANRVSVIPIIRYIEENFLTCTQRSVAERFFISTNYVSTLLKRHTGMTYIQMVQAQKLAHAALLLRTGTLPIEEVARRCGYENLSFFYRKFERQYGIKPGEYRARKA